jgi:hypothetical protein
MSTATELLRRALDWIEYDPELVEEIRAYLATEKEAEQEPAAWMFPDDLERFQTDETFAQAFSVKCGSPTQGTTLPLFLHPPKSVEAIDRNKTIEECALACENAMPMNPVSGAVIDRCAGAIRGLKK